MPVLSKQRSCWRLTPTYSVGFEGLLAARAAKNGANALAVGLAIERMDLAQEGNGAWRGKTKFYFCLFSSDMQSTIALYNLTLLSLAPKWG